MLSEDGQTVYNILLSVFDDIIVNKIFNFSSRHKYLLFTTVGLIHFPKKIETFENAIACT